MGPAPQPHPFLLFHQHVAGGGVAQGWVQRSFGTAYEQRVRAPRCGAKASAARSDVGWVARRTTIRGESSGRRWTTVLITPCIYYSSTTITSSPAAKTMSSPASGPCWKLMDIAPRHTCA